MKQPKSFEEGMDRLQGLLTQLQDVRRGRRADPLL